MTFWPDHLPSGNQKATLARSRGVGEALSGGLVNGKIA